MGIDSEEAVPTNAASTASCKSAAFGSDTTGVCTAGISAEATAARNLASICSMLMLSDAFTVCCGAAAMGLDAADTAYGTVSSGSCNCDKSGTGMARSCRSEVGVGLGSGCWICCNGADAACSVKAGCV